MLNYNHLYYFYVVVREGGISAASRVLSVSQPALSAQIKQFEDRLEQPLFHRTGRTLQLTDRGRLVYGYARPIFELGQEMEEDLRKLAKPVQTRIQLGVADDVDRPFAIKLVRHLLRGKMALRRPLVSFVTGPHDTLLQQLRRQNLDAILADQPAYCEDLFSLGVSEMPVVLAVPSETRFANLPPWQDKLSRLIDELTTLGSGFVMPSPRLKLRLEIDRFLRENQLRAPLVLESDSMASVVRAVREGVGVGFLPRPYIEEGVEAREILSCGPRQGFWKHTLCLLSPPSASEGPIAIELKAAFETLDRDFRA